MNSLANLFTVMLLAGGVAFFIAGTVGLLRFPDPHARLHALTKADNVGLGLVAIALAPQTGSVWLTFKLLFIWFLAALASATVSQLIARTALSGRESLSEGEGA